MTIIIKCNEQNYTDKQNNYIRAVFMWEYRTETFDSTFDSKKSLKRKMDRILSECGSEGWELVNFQCAGILGSITILTFKKPIIR